MAYPVIVPINALDKLQVAGFSLLGGLFLVLLLPWTARCIKDRYHYIDVISLQPKRRHFVAVVYAGIVSLPFLLFVLGDKVLRNCADTDQLNVFEEYCLVLVYILLPTFLATLRPPSKMPLSFADIVLIMLIWVPQELAYWVVPSDIPDTQVTFSEAFVNVSILRMTGVLLVLLVFDIVRPLADTGIGSQWTCSPKTDMPRLAVGLFLLAALILPIALGTGVITGSATSDLTFGALALNLLNIFLVISLPYELFFRGVVQNFLHAKLDAMEESKLYSSIDTLSPENSQNQSLVAGGAAGSHSGTSTPVEDFYSSQRAGEEQINFMMVPQRGGAAHVAAKEPRLGVMVINGDARKGYDTIPSSPLAVSASASVSASSGSAPAPAPVVVIQSPRNVNKGTEGGAGGRQVSTGGGGGGGRSGRRGGRINRHGDLVDVAEVAVKAERAAAGADARGGDDLRETLVGDAAIFASGIGAIDDAYLRMGSDLEVEMEMDADVDAEDSDEDVNSSMPSGGVFVSWHDKNKQHFNQGCVSLFVFPHLRDYVALFVATALCTTHLVLELCEHAVMATSPVAAVVIVLFLCSVVCGYVWRITSNVLCSAVVNCIAIFLAASVMRIA